MTKQKSMKRVFIRHLKIAVWALAACVLAPNLLAQDKQRQPKQYQPPPPSVAGEAQAAGTLVVSPDEDYLIGPSDVIEIKVEDAPELSGVFRLSAKGAFTLPVVGKVTAEKRRTEDVAEEIAGRLRGDYLMHPIVTVSVKQSNSRAFFVQGAIRRPGFYQIEGRPSLLKLITIAGGLQDNYGATAFIIREKKKPEPAPSGGAADALAAPDAGRDATDPADKTVEATDEFEVIKANINNLLKGNLEQNVMIEPGDIVHVPQTDIFFVAGEVKAPGSFPLKEGTTLRQAISLAQGTTFEGNLDQSVIFREDASGKRQEIKIDVAGVMAGKKEDIDIYPNDIIIVPNSKKKAVAKSLLKTISGGLPRLLFGF